MKTVKIALIGAGISGITAANYLRERGEHDLLLIDKGRSVGGRLATRRIENGRADHGAQFFTVREAAFKKECERWIENGWVTKWFGDPHPRYKSEGGMNQLAKKLAEDLPVMLSTRITKIEKENAHYLLYAEDECVVKAEKIIITSPVPQTVELLENSAIPVETEQWHKLNDITYYPSLVALMTVAEHLSIGESGHLDQGLPKEVERIAHQKQKGISDAPIISVYMSGEWAESRFEQDEKKTLDEIFDCIDSIIPGEAVEEVQLKKWRYAQGKSVVHEPFIQLDEESILIGGDLFLQPDDQAGRSRVESAFLSGKAMAENI